MNAVEIEESLSALAAAPFDRAEFPYAFLTAFGAKGTTLKRLRKGETNGSDLPEGLLWRNNIHLVVCDAGAVGDAIAALRNSPKTTQAKAKFILATDGKWFEAEDLISGEHLPCAFDKFADHFGFFLPLAGISTIKELKDNPVDVRATGRLNKLYVELLSNNESWATAKRRHDMNHFMARLIFCYFAEDTDIFQGASLFTRTIDQMTQSDGSNVHEVLETIFQAMNMSRDERGRSRLPGWAQRFPYVNGGLFSGSTDVPRFTRAARSFLIRAGELDWKEINPDIFGSMIQAVADDDERGALGMHYTSVPNILKVLNPLFLDDLRAQLEAADENKAKLLNLRKRMSRIRVFDPACGSGNFLVIAYKQMRELEAEINRRRGEPDLRTEIPLTNFRGIELRSFPAEIARLALIIAEFQSDVLYRGQKEALAEVLPLDSENWITCDNALRLDWLKLMDADASGVAFVGDDLFKPTTDQAKVGFENEPGETYICGNPPYKGARDQTVDQKDDLARIFDKRLKGWGQLDYVSAWFVKAIDYGMETNANFAFVATNSICQGLHVSVLWPLIFESGHEVTFAHTSFKWANLAQRNAGVTVVVVGMSRAAPAERRLISEGKDPESAMVKVVANINAYLVAAPNIIVSASTRPLSGKSEMSYGNYPGDGNHLSITSDQRNDLLLRRPDLRNLVRPVFGAQEFLKGLSRYCLWIEDDQLSEALGDQFIADRVEAVRKTRLASRDVSLNKLAKRPHQYRDRNTAREHLILVPTVSSESREFLPVDLKSAESATTNQAFAIYDGPLHDLALLSSRLHLVWIATVCGKMKTDFRYSNTLGWNTFPVPALTEGNRADLCQCATDILLAREAHYPATIAKLYERENMPDELRRAHERNDEVLERIYIGRRFRNDTERLEKLFELYTKMNVSTAKVNKVSKAK